MPVGLLEVEGTIDVGQFRSVGDIEVTVACETVDINHLLVEQGFAYPTFYASMNEDEIRALLALAKTARTWKLPLRKRLARIFSNARDGSRTCTPRRRRVRVWILIPPRPR